MGSFGLGAFCKAVSAQSFYKNPFRITIISVVLKVFSHTSSQNFFHGVRSLRITANSVLVIGAMVVFGQLPG